MSSKTMPGIEAQAIVLREAGYSCPSIAVHLDISLSTTKRILKRRGVVAGTANEAIVEQTRQEMLNIVFEMETVQRCAAALALEDLSMARMIREKTMQAMEALDPSKCTPYQMMRATVAAATALDLTQKINRRALPLERLAEFTHITELPELQIRIMTGEDVQAMREQQRLESVARGSSPALAADPEDNDIIESIS
jgi:hypothetical protein